MDYAELNKRFSYTDMNSPSADPNYVVCNDLISDEEDYHQFGLRVLADNRPDPRTLEVQGKQSQTDSVSILRQQYGGYGTRYADDPVNYHSELFLEQTEKEPRRTFVDPDFREATKMAWARQQHQIINLYPEDPSSGTITMGTKSKQGELIQMLQGRALSEGRYKSLLQDSLDGVEPRRVFQYDNYRYLDKAIANQGDMPMLQFKQDMPNRPMHPIAAVPGGPVVGWTDGHVVFHVAKLGRSASAHISAEDNQRILTSQKHIPNSDMTEQNRLGIMTDQNLVYGAGNLTSTTLNDTIRKIVDDTIRAESTAAKSANKGLDWGSVREHIRRAVDAAVRQMHMQQYVEAQNEKGIVGSRVRVNGGGAYLLKNQSPDVAANSSLNLLSRFRDAMNSTGIPMSKIVGNTVTSQQVQAEVNKVNENWRMELSDNIQKSRSSVNDNFQGLMASVQTTEPWYAHFNRSLEVANFRSKAPTDMGSIIRHPTTETNPANMANDQTGKNRGVGLSGGDTNSLVYAANNGMAFYPEFAAASGSMAGVSGPLTTKQKARFDTAENGQWVDDPYDLGEVKGR